MRNTFLPFSKPSITEPEIQAVANVLRSGWLATGPNASKFEEEFAVSAAVPLAQISSVQHTRRPPASTVWFDHVSVKWFPLAGAAYSASSALGIGHLESQTERHG